MNNQHAARTKFMVELALMVAIIFVMAFTPLGYFQTMGLSITFLTVPVAVGAIILGPKGGAICGLAFGITSFMQCFGMGAFGTMLFPSTRWELHLCVSYQDFWKDCSVV